MPIYLGSRYERAPLARVRGVDGEKRPTVYPRTLPDERFGFTPHVVVAGDRLDLIAYSTFGDPNLWWVIADANPELGVPEPLVPGSVLRVPDGLR